MLDQIEATRGMALIIAPSLGPEIRHEIIHSIDPNESKRSPSDEVIEEFGAYYEEVYHPRIYAQTTVQTDEHGHKSAPQVTSREVFQTIPKICQTLKDDLYSNKYAVNFSSRESYFARVDEIGNLLKQLGEHMRPQEIHKVILNAKSYYELSRLLEVIKREKLNR